MKLLRNSLRTQLVIASCVGLAFIVVSMSYILFVTLRIQQIVDAQFQRERFFQELQLEVEEIRRPLLNYLSTRSSQALAELLAEEQTLRGMIPTDLPITDDPVDLASREIFALLESYLDMIQEAVTLKRARAIEEYTTLFETLQSLNQHITARIDRISLYGLRRELANYEAIIAESRQLLSWNFMVIIFAFLSAIFWILVSMKRITVPMDRLAQMAGQISSGNFEIEDIRIDTVQELGAVVAAFNTMKHDIRQYIAEINRQKQLEQGYMAEKLRNMKMEQLLKRMELYTMQAQMNPHFLFNTLNTGVQLAITENAERTADFMDHVAAFLRQNIRDRDLIVSLRHEVEGLESYLQILRIRFAQTVLFSLDIPEDLLDACFVPALILQPLVENSVIHAFKGVSHTGEILVSARREGSLVYIGVRDNGVGMTGEKIQELLSRHTRDEERSPKAMGLENVVQRLYFFYPDNEEIVRIHSGINGGTEIVICIDTEEEACIPS